MAQACAEAQEMSINATHDFSNFMVQIAAKLAPLGTSGNSDVDTTSQSGTMSPLMLKPREDVEKHAESAKKSARMKYLLIHKLSHQKMLMSENLSEM